MVIHGADYILYNSLCMGSLCHLSFFIHKRKFSENFKKKGKLPLVIVFHRLFENSTYTRDTYGITELSYKEGFIVAYPEGTGELNNVLLSWNAGFCCGHAMENQIDDVGYITESLTLLKQRYNVDNGRIYLIGFSNAGLLTYKLISEHPELFTAAAIISSSPSG